MTAGIVTVRVSSQSLLREPHSSLTLLTSLFFCGTPHILSVEDLLLTVFSLITSEQILLDCCNALTGVKARRWRVSDFESLVLGWRAFRCGWGPGSLLGGSD